MIEDKKPISAEQYEQKIKMLEDELSLLSRSLEDVQERARAERSAWRKKQSNHLQGLNSFLHSLSKDLGKAQTDLLRNMANLQAVILTDQQSKIEEINLLMANANKLIGQE